MDRDLIVIKPIPDSYQKPWKPGNVCSAGQQNSPWYRNPALVPKLGNGDRTGSGQRSQNPGNPRTYRLRSRLVLLDGITARAGRYRVRIPTDPRKPDSRNGDKP